MSETVYNLAGLVVLAALVIWIMILAFRRSEERPLLLVKWCVTGAVVGFIRFQLAPIIDAGGYAAAGAVLILAACGWILAITWRRSLSSMIAKPFGDLYDGGDRQIDRAPLYSAALAKRKRGNYAEAVAEIRKQLGMFPQDFQGQLLLAEILAENLNDLPGAEIAVHRLCRQTGHAPRHLMLALNCLADWQLKYHQDRDAARSALQKIIDLFPETELAALAEQRIARLADTASLLASHDRKPMPMLPGVADMGLLPVAQQPRAPEEDESGKAKTYVDHLTQHPLDTEAREKLAILYADHYGRLDLASDQLEQLIRHPGQSAKRAARWLNLLADLQIRHGADPETVRQTVQRVVLLFPDSPAAQLAQNRLNLLPLEFKARTQTPTVKLGVYEQDIGLKRGLPHQP